MKTALVFFLFFVIVGYADDAPANEFKRVASIRWDLQAGKLEWVVETGSVGEKGFVPSSEEHYQISPKEGVMAFQGQQREFGTQEATRLGDLLRILTGYCVARTIWWLSGETVPPPDEKPTTPPSSEPAPTTNQTPIGTPLGKVGPQQLAKPGNIQTAHVLGQ